MGHCHAKQKMFRSVGLKMDEKQSVTFALFFFISESPKDHLNLYSALMVMTATLYFGCYHIRIMGWGKIGLMIVLC